MNYCHAVNTLSIDYSQLLFTLFPLNIVKCKIREGPKFNFASLTQKFMLNSLKVSTYFLLKGLLGAKCGQFKEKTYTYIGLFWFSLTLISRKDECTTCKSCFNRMLRGKIMANLTNLKGPVN